jgi:hypothetical protein
MGERYGDLMGRASGWGFEFKLKLWKGCSWKAKEVENGEATEMSDERWWWWPAATKVNKQTQNSK